MSVFIHQGHANIVRLLIAYGVALNDDNNVMYTPLTLAAAMGHEEVTKILIENGIDINGKSHGGRRALNGSVQHNFARFFLLY